MEHHYVRPLTRVREPRRLLFLDADIDWRPVGPLRSRATFRAAGALYVERPPAPRRGYREYKAITSPSDFAHFLGKVARWGGALTIIVLGGGEAAEVCKLEAAICAAGGSVATVIRAPGIYLLYGSHRAGGICALGVANLRPTGPPFLGALRERLDHASQWLEDHTKRLRSERLGPFRPTLAGQAMAAFRFRFLPPGLMAPHADRWTTLARSAFRGGWVEAFKKGDLSGETWYALDTNGSYLAAMRDCALPLRPLRFAREKYAESLIEEQGPEPCIALVDVLAGAELCPPHMRVDRADARGMVSLALAGPELSLALARGLVRRVREVAVYRVSNFLRPWAEYVWERRQAARAAGDAELAAWWKLLGVSLFGKFAQQTEVWGANVDDWLDDGESQLVYDSDLRVVQVFRNGAAGPERLSGRREHKNAAVGISASIAAFARMHLRTLIARAGPENVAYVDTDSLIVNRGGFDRLSGELSSIRLGALKLEGVSDRLIIRGKRNYDFGERRVLAGFAWDGTYSEDGGRMGVRRVAIPGEGVEERRYAYTPEGAAQISRPA